MKLVFFLRINLIILLLRAMDGFEVNGLRLFSLSIPEPSVKNLFAVNEFYRNNDDFINPDLQERLVIGDYSISIFTYDIKGDAANLLI